MIRKTEKMLDFILNYGILIFKRQAINERSTAMAQVNYYYSERQAADIGVEDGALHLCRACATKHADQVQWLSKGDDQSECEFCDASNDPAYSRELDALFAKVNGR